MNADELLIETPRLVMCLPPAEAAGQLAAYHQRNAEHLAPWSPPGTQRFQSAEFWRERLSANRADFEAGRSLCLVVFERGAAEGRITGVVNFTQIFRGAFQACHLGYHLDAAAQGKGLMHEALMGAITFVFQELKLHRVMANYMPSNQRSARVLERLGFVIEGEAKDYLFLDGAWQDHVLTALTNPLAPDPESIEIAKK